MAVVPNTNVNLATNVRDVLNGAGASVGNEVKAYFSSSVIKAWWSKFKPTIYPNADFLDDDRRWQGYNGLCGFTRGSVVFNDTSALVTAYKNGAVFVYDCPQGTASEPMRLGDFRGYYTDAKPPILSFTISGQMAANNSASSSTFTILGNGDINPTYNLRMSDILSNEVTSLASYYFGVIIVNSSGAIKLTKKSSSTIGTAANFTKSVTVTMSELGLAGKYTAYPCFIDPTGKKFIACPISSIPFKIINSANEGQVGWVEGSGSVRLQAGAIYFAGQLIYAKSFGGNNVMVQPYVMQSNGTRVNIGSSITITLPTTSSDRGTYNFSTSSKNYANKSGDIYWLQVSYGNNYADKNYLNLGALLSPEPL